MRPEAKGLSPQKGYQMPARALPVLLMLLVACAPPPASESLPVSGRTLAGAWNIVFTLDSQLVSRNDDPVLSWRRASDSVAVTGIMKDGRESSSTDASGARTARTTVLMTADFTPLLGRQMSCFEPGKRELESEWDGDRVAIAFTPNVADCGFGGLGVWRSDTIRGVWSETSFVGPVSIGRFVMARR